MLISHRTYDGRVHAAGSLSTMCICRVVLDGAHMRFRIAAAFHWGAMHATSGVMRQEQAMVPFLPAVCSLNPVILWLDYSITSKMQIPTSRRRAGDAEAGGAGSPVQSCSGAA